MSGEDQPLSSARSVASDISVLSDSNASIMALLSGVRFDHTTKLPTLPARGSRRFLLHDHPDSIFSPSSIAKANPKQKVCRAAPVLQCPVCCRARGVTYV